jgi:hypothetical protein
MKVRFTAEITMDIPGEFQDDAEAVQLITDELRDRLETEVEYDKYDQPSLMFLTAQIRSYFVTAGKI